MRLPKGANQPLDPTVLKGAFSSLNPSIHHAPYIRHPESSRTVMSDTIIALVPLFFMSYFYYGPRVFLVGGVSVLTCLLADWMTSLLLHQKINLRDLSPVVTGILITMLVPPAVELYVVVWAALFAILVAKAPFGGTGHNIFNPAAAGLAFATICWSSQMFRYTPTMQRLPLVIDEAVRFVQGPTATLKLGGISRIGLTELLLGNFPGPIGSTYTLIIFACLIYLIARNAVRWYVPVSYVTAVSLLAAFNHPFGVTPLESIANELFAGSLFFVAVYLLGDPVTTPKYRISRVLYGFSAGLLTMLFRYYSPFELSAVFAILSMNALGPAFDCFCEWLMPRLHQLPASAENTREGGARS